MLRRGAETAGGENTKTYEIVFRPYAVGSDAAAVLAAASSEVADDDASSEVADAAAAAAATVLFLMAALAAFFSTNFFPMLFQYPDASSSSSSTPLLECDFAVGPSGDDPFLLRSFVRLAQHCGRGHGRRCLRRPWEESIERTCAGENPLSLPPGVKGVGQVIEVKGIL